MYRLITDDSTAHNSTKSAKITQSVVSVNASNIKVYYNNVPIEKDTIYTLAFWAKVDVLEGKQRELDVYVQTLDDTPKVVFLRTITLDSVDWKEYVNVFTVPKDVEGNVMISLLVGLSNVDFWIDDFRFFEGEPTDEIKAGETPVNPTNKIPVSWGQIKSLR